MDSPSLISNDHIVSDLRSALLHGAAGLKDVPTILKEAIQKDAWRRRIIPTTGEIVEFTRFEEFVAAAPLRGLGADVKTLHNICRDDKEALDSLDRATQRTCADNEPLSNIQKQAPAGTTSAAALRRLRKDRPDLHAQVIAGEKSPHAAAVEAGFRRKGITVPLDADRAASTLRRHFNAEECARIARLIVE